MKLITREVRVYKYTFANVDVGSGVLMNKITITRPEKITRAEKKQISEQNNGAIMVHIDQDSVRYSLPVTEFIAACENYAERVAAGEAEAIDETADDQDDFEGYADTDSMHDD